MRPLRLMIDGFGSYREPADLALSDVDFFVLTGPTGAGKSTVIDAMCFALYGTVPRWGNESVIRNALAPSASSCRVGLVFEVGDQRYVVARLLARNAKGVVQTKAARLERLGDSVPIDADLDRLLEASAQQLAEGLHVTDAVAKLLGVSYEHFTKCVLLPQGQFAEFLNAKPGDRQDLLIELLAFAVYEDIGQRARERAKLAASKADLLEKQLTTLGPVTQEAIDAATRRVDELAALTPAVGSAVDSIAELRTLYSTARQRTSECRAQLAELTGLRMPADVPELAARLASAAEQVDKRIAELEALEQAEATAEERCAGLTSLSTLERWREAHRRDSLLRKQLTAARQEFEAARSTEVSAKAALADAEHAATEAEIALRRTEQQHRAAALAGDLHPGEPCPVCLQDIGDIPHHDVPADLDAAKASDKAAKASLADAHKHLTTATSASAAARSKASTVDNQLAEVAALLAEAPEATEVDAALASRTAADAALQKARSAVRTAKSAVAKAQRARDGLRDEEQRAWSALRAGRDRFVALSAPAIDGLDLAAAWQTLLAWAQDQVTSLGSAARDLEDTEKSLLSKGKAASAKLATLLAEHGVPPGDQPQVALAKQQERAAGELESLRAKQERATALRAELATCKEEAEVAAMLGNLLRSNGFERWLCAEALDSLVLEASETLMQLSGNQYQLDRDERNEFVVIDHNDAGTRRPVNTLSGGETFQASLALALALSHQVIGLSGGRRSLGAMFLDEGFGTLDEVTLDTVASTLERLVERTGSMIGIVTHVPALAERVPVQFAVTRTGASSRIERVGV
jgi:exonuclease SbcC